MALSIIVIGSILSQRIWFLAENYREIFDRKAFAVSTLLECAIILLFLFFLRLANRPIQRLFMISWQILFFLLLVDQAYFRESKKHIDFELVFLGDSIAWHLVWASFFAHKELLLFFIAFSVAGWVKVPYRTSQLTTMHSVRISLLSILIGSLMCYNSKLPLFTENPLHAIAVAFWGNSLSARRGDAKIPTLSLDMRNEREVQEEGYRKRTFLHGYPRLPHGRRNLVLIVLEGWSKKYLFQRVGKTEVTPYLKSLAEMSTVAQAAHATGNRTITGLKSILLGIPELPRQEITLAIPEKLRHVSLPHYLSQAGYNTVFLTAATLGVPQAELHLRNWGFGEVQLIGPADTGRSNPDSQGACPDDEITYSAVLGRASDMIREPFFIAALTSMTHFPFATSVDEELFPHDMKDRRYVASLRAADRAMSRFMSSMAKLPHFQRTLFIFIADHTHHRNLSVFEDREIPFLIYDPGTRRKRFIEKPASQIDVLPTALYLMDFQGSFYAIGKNILGSAKTDSYFAYGGQFGLLSGDYIFRKSIHAKLNASLYHKNDTALHNNLCFDLEFERTCAEHSQTAESTLSQSEELWTSWK